MSQTSDAMTGEQILGPLRILLVEDSLDIAAVMVEVLEELGHQVTVAYHPDDALDCVKVAHFDFFLLDIGLPGMSGYELVAILRRHFTRERVTFVAHTGLGNPADKARSQSAGFDLHIVKPASPHMLKAALDDARLFTRFGLRKANIESLLAKDTCH